MNTYSFYIIKDEFFNLFPDPYLKKNKQKNRPHYFSVIDRKTGLNWVIPLSSKVEKYKTITNNDIKKHGRSDKLHILNLAGKNSVFLIQDMFPILSKFIEREYTINNVPLKLKNKDDIKEINSKASKILTLIKKGIKFMPTQVNVLKIEDDLINMHIKDLYKEIFPAIKYSSPIVSKLINQLNIEYNTTLSIANIKSKYLEAGRKYENNPSPENIKEFNKYKEIIEFFRVSEKLFYKEEKQQISKEFDKTQEL